MKKILYTVTLLLSVGVFMPFFALSALDTGINYWFHKEMPTESKTLDKNLESYFSQLFVVTSDNKQLAFEVYSTDGKKIPGHIYRHHKGDNITYEIGRGLNEGLYIIKMSSKETHQYFKLIRFGY